MIPTYFGGYALDAVLDLGDQQKHDHISGKDIEMDVPQYEFDNVVSK